MSDLNDLTNPAGGAGGTASGTGAGAVPATDHPDLARPSEPGSEATEADGSLGPAADVDPEQLPQDGSGVGVADADRGNLDGTTASNGPREHSLEQAKGNGSFGDASDADASDTDEARMASDAGESGQDGGSMS